PARRRCRRTAPGPPPRRWREVASEADDRACGGAGDVRHLLDPGDELAEVVDGGGLDPHDDVVGRGRVLGRDHTPDPGDLPRHGRRLADLGLDEDVSLDHHDLLVNAALAARYRARSAAAGNP